MSKAPRSSAEFAVEAGGYEHVGLNIVKNLEIGSNIIGTLGQHGIESWRLWREGHWKWDRGIG